MRKGDLNGRDSCSMGSYLEMIPLSARVHRRQSRMTRICIVLAVALVSVIFGMADMEIRCQKIQTISENGNWHAAFKRLSKEQEALLAARPEVEQAMWYDVVNYRLDQEYRLNSAQTVVCGAEEEYFELFPSVGLEEGEFSRDENSALFSLNVKERLGAEVGDDVKLTLPDGSVRLLTVSGFTQNSSSLIARDAFGVIVNRELFAQLAPDEVQENEDGVIYVRFASGCNIRKVLEDVRIQLGLEQEQISQNVILLGLMGQSGDPYIMQLYMVAAVLAVLVMAAGVLMITGSLNSNIAQRTEFFGMLRCLGATPAQVIRFVRLEALNWCKSAIPCGLLTGMLVVWALCALLRYLSPVYFGSMPSRGISPLGILAGALLGVVTVLFAAQPPAKKASRVSALTAVSGNVKIQSPAKRAAATKVFPVDAALGVHHAVGSKRNFLLMTGSFAFTVILFLAFSASIDFMNHAITPLQPYTPDLSIVSSDNTCSVDRGLLEKIKADPAVKRAYGRQFAYDVPVLLDGQEGRINLISSEKYQFEWAQDMLVTGSVKEAQDGDGVMIEYVNEGRNAVQPGSVITMGDQTLRVSAVLSNTPFSREEGTETVICSEEMFERLTGERDYTIIDVQLNKGAGDEEAERIRELAGDGVTFSDRRMRNQETKGTYYGYAVFLYGFLAVIIMISAFNIINSIAMSVAARMRQYGAMRAVGMSCGQLVKMVAAEAVTYVVCGVGIGAAAGICLHKFIFEHMVTFRWGTPWHVPAGYVGIIIAIVASSAALAVMGPAKRIREMSVVDTIGDC